MGVALVIIGIAVVWVSIDAESLAMFLGGLFVIAYGLTLTGWL